jgi:hypothetical protein
VIDVGARQADIARSIGENCIAGIVGGGITPSALKGDGPSCRSDGTGCPGRTGYALRTSQSNWTDVALRSLRARDSLCSLWASGTGGTGLPSCARYALLG